jgi:hypothetical protein
MDGGKRMTNTKPLPITHSDTIILQALLETAEFTEATAGLANSLYSKLITIEQEFRHEAGVIQ